LREIERQILREIFKKKSKKNSSARNERVALWQQQFSNGPLHLELLKTPTKKVKTQS
jgi:hypothetical protein